MLRKGTSTGVAAIAAIALSLSLSGCGGGNGIGTGATPSMALSGAGGSQIMSAATEQQAREPLLPTVDADNLAATDVDGPEGASILAKLNTSTTIGSTVDPITGDVNPYSLAIAPSTSGLLHQGDLVVCDFNDRANVEGTGNSLIALSPAPGSSPVPIFSKHALLGCTESVVTKNGDIWTAAFVAPDLAVVSPSGTLVSTFSGAPFTAPFGITIAKDPDTAGNTVFYEGDAKNGDVVRITAGPFGITTAVIATGFAVNNAVPGAELGPGGLQYDRGHDRLYVVDGTNNTLVELRHVSTIPAYGITVHRDGKSFGGPFARRGRLVYAGFPLNAPISSALFPNGNVVIGNTGNPNGENFMVEITPRGRIAFVRNVDTGASGSIFGMVSSGHDTGDVKLYFGDDNDNAVIVLTR